MPLILSDGVCRGSLCFTIALPLTVPLKPTLMTRLMMHVKIFVFTSLQGGQPGGPGTAHTEGESVSTSCIQSAIIVSQRNGDLHN